MKRLILALSVVTVLIAAAALLVPPATGGGNGIVASATGSGHLSLPLGKRTFSFTGRVYADGSASGQALLVRHDIPRQFHLRVNCVAVSGATAYISGALDELTGLGQYGFVATQDNGEGGNGAVDRISLMPVDDVPFDCADPVMQAWGDAELRPIDGGNIQVG